MWDGCLGGFILHDYSYNDAFENNLLQSNNHNGPGNCQRVINILNEKKDQMDAKVFSRFFCLYAHY